MALHVLKEVSPNRFPLAIHNSMVLKLAEDIEWEGIIGIR